MQVKIFYAKGLYDSNKESLACKIVEEARPHITLPDIVEIEFQRMGPSMYGQTDVSRKRITINFDLDLNDIFIPLLHELIHLEQIHTGKLAKSREGKYVWEGAVYRVDPARMLYKDYNKLPWELDVAKKQQDLLEKLLKN